MAAQPLEAIAVRLIAPAPAPAPSRLATAPSPLPPKPSRQPPVPTPRPVIALPQEAANPTPAFAIPAPPPATSPAQPVPPAPPAPAATAATATPARFDAAYLNNPEPGYPAASRRLGEEGRVLLRVRVSAAGQPVAVDVEKSSRFERLDEAARQAVARWRFVPARRGDEAVESSVLVPIVFRLND